MKKNRRAFIKLAGIAAAGLAVAPRAMASSGGHSPVAANPKAVHAKQWAMVIDTTKLHSKEDIAKLADICHSIHNVPTASGKKEIKWLWSDTYGHTFPEQENPHLAEEVHHRAYALLCNHCENPSCVRVCPTQATFKRPDGIVAMDYHRCIGCRYCMAACPFGSRSFNWGEPRKNLDLTKLNPEFPTRMRGVVEKCNFCVERLAVGKMPACVEASEGAIVFGDLYDPESPVRKVLREKFTIRRKPAVGTEPCVYYVIQGGIRMLELALKGSKRYYGWIAFLLVLIGIGSTAYLDQILNGLEITGMSRDVSWGFYISQFTYLVGLAASGVMIVLPNYFHSYKTNKHMVIFGEFMAIAACIMCMLFIAVDVGQPTRMLNVMLHPTPNSILFWDMTVLIGYLSLNLLVGWLCLQADRVRLPHPQWLKPFIYVSIVWAFSIHTVTAFLYQGLPGRHYWLTAILAARFLASAFCSGPAILLLVLLVTEKVTTFKMPKNAVKTLVKIIAYAMCVNMFFFALEIFTSFYSNIPGHMHPILYLFEHASTGLVTLMWTFIAFAAISITALTTPKLRNNLKLLPWTLVILVIATWIDKGLGLLIGGFNPSPFETVASYWPTGKELLVSMMVYAIGALVVTILFKIATEVKEEMGHSQALPCGCSSEDKCDCAAKAEAAMEMAKAVEAEQSRLTASPRNVISLGQG